MTHTPFRPREEGPRLPPRGIGLRRAQAEDEAAAFDIMRRAMGHDMNWAHHANTRRHLRNAPHSSFWLAEETPRFGKARPVGYAHSITRDRVWCLTEFFVLPTHHRQGIGRALLSRCLVDGDAAGADTRLVLASPHASADALYMRRAGCFPRVPMLLLSGPAANLQMLPPDIQVTIADAILPSTSVLIAPDGAFSGNFGRPALAAPLLRAEPLVLTPDIQRQIDVLDRDTVGYARAPEHALWSEEMGGAMGASRLFHDGNTGQIAGYAYFGPYSSGPALALTPALLPHLIAHVMRVSRQYERSTQGAHLFEPADPYWAVAGTNEVLLRWLLDCGWQIVFQYLFMSTRPLGRLDRYACHNPLYML